MYMERRETDMWYAVWIRTGQEEKLLGLCRQRLEHDKAADEAGEAPGETGPAFESCFVPKYERAWRIGGRWEKREEILFPGYLFFITEYPDILYRLLKEIPEFTKLLGDEDGPIPLYGHEVEFLEKYTNPDHVLEMSTGEMIGDRLIVTDGALKGYEGKVVSFDRHRRFVTLEMGFFGKTVNMTVGMEIVRRTGRLGMMKDG